MGRWTKNQKEMQGYKRKLAYGQQKISLAKAPWEKGEQHGKREEVRESLEISDRKSSSNG